MTETYDLPQMKLLDSTPSPGPLLSWRRYRFPIDWGAQFADGAPDAKLHLEIGFGDGRYTARRAQSEPEARFAALEISSVSVKRAMTRMRREGLRNVRLLKVGAQFAVQHLFAPRSLQTVTVNFPDPWPKGRHEENRLLRAPFFRLAASRLVPGGRVLLATDHADYLAFARAEAVASGLFALHDAEPPPAVFETKYALKWKGQGKPLYYQVFAYEGGEPPAFEILERVETMPHATLTGQLPEQLVFSKQVWPYAGGYVILHEAARSFGSDEHADTASLPTGPGERWLLRATVDEPDLRQQVLVSVRRREAGDLIVGLEPFGDPVVTKAVRGAVHAVTEWLLTLPSEIRVVTRAY